MCVNHIPISGIPNPVGIPEQNVHTAGMALIQVKAAPKRKRVEVHSSTALDSRTARINVLLLIPVSFSTSV